MSKIAINELFHELGTAEQETHRGGMNRGDSGHWDTLSPGSLYGKPAIQKMPRVPMYTYRFVQDQEALANFLETATQADIYGW